MAIILILIVVAVMGYCYWQLMQWIHDEFPTMRDDVSYFIMIVFFAIFFAITGMIGGAISDAAGL